MERILLAVGVLVFVLALIGGGAFLMLRSQSVNAVRAQQQMLIAREAQEAAMAAELVDSATAAGRRQALKRASRKSYLRSLELRLQDAVRRAGRLAPAHPDIAPDLVKWVDRHGEPMAAEMSVLRALIENLESNERDASAAAKLQRARKLHTELAAFLAPGGIKAQVETRSIWSRSVKEMTNAHPKATVRWADARLLIRDSAAYAEHAIDILPQMGLVPIGADHATGRWQFYHLRSAWQPDVEIDPANLALPKRDAQGGLQKIADGGVVFELIPGSKERAPFFLSAEPLTKAQSARLAAGLSLHRLRVATPADGKQAGVASVEGRVARDLVR